MTMYQSHYSRFLGAAPHRLHFAAHSHHLWLDVTREAQLQYWDDSARYADKKWRHIFSTVIPEAQRHIASLLELSYPEQIVFAPNTHEFVARLFSALDWSKPVKILTTDSEFYSFSRQLARLQEAMPSMLLARKIPTEPFETFEARFCEAIANERFDMIFFSHVFFNSGFVISDLERLVSSVASPKTLIVIDGYHGFCAIPTSLRKIESRVFYLSGGYKYAQSGEGVCFLVVPKGCTLRPVYTGWFAEFGALAEEHHEEVAYSSDGQRFAGATFDPSGLYRFNAAMRWLAAQHLSVEAIDNYVKHLQACFLQRLEASSIKALPLSALRPSRNLTQCGHFLTFELEDAAALEAALLAKDIYIDRRANRLRFGFGLYHTHADIDRLIERLQSL